MTLERINSILSQDKSLTEWRQLLDSAKVSDIPTHLKSYLIDEVQYKIDGRRHSKDAVLQDIEEGMADLDDIN